MTPRVRAFSRIPPSLLRPLVLRWLFRSTARAFGASRPSWWRVRGKDLLPAYAAFSSVRSQLLIGGGGDLDAIRRDLWTSAHRIGLGLRRCLGIRSTEDAIVAAHAVYRPLGIDLRGSPAGGIVVPRCSFGRIYTPEVCAVMSSLDAGLLAGLTGGRCLTFAGRISEGASACTATLSPPTAEAA